MRSIKIGDCKSNRDFTITISYLLGRNELRWFKDTLAQLAKAERIDKLQQTFKGVEDDYLRILKVGSNGFNRDGEETDESEVSEDDNNDNVEHRPSKKARTQWMVAVGNWSVYYNTIIKPFRKPIFNSRSANIYNIIVFVIREDGLPRLHCMRIGRCKLVYGNSRQLWHCKPWLFPFEISDHILRLSYMSYFKQGTNYRKCIRGLFQQRKSLSPDAGFLEYYDRYDYSPVWGAWKGDSLLNPQGHNDVGFLVEFIKPTVVKCSEQRQIHQ